jgi:hypothetical protein
MSSSNLRGNFKKGLEKIDFNGFLTGFVVHHEPTGYKVGVYIPKVMPEHFPNEESNGSYDKININTDIVLNENKPPVDNVVHRSNFIIVSPCYWIRKCYTNRYDTVKGKYGYPRARYPALNYDIPMLDSATPSGEYEPHKERNEIGMNNFHGSIVRLLSNQASNHDPTPGDHSVFNPHIDTIDSAEITISNLTSNNRINRQMDTRERSCTTHLWGEQLDAVYREALPVLGEELLLLFLDGDPEKGYYLPFTV